MFKIVDKRTFTHDVKVLTPADGGFAEESLKTTFNYLTSEAIKSFDLRTVEGTGGLLEAAVVTFHELGDDHDLPVACTPEIRSQLFVNPNVRLALVAHYLDAVTKVKEGN